MAEVRYYGTGKRKTAIARVWLIPNGSGKITVRISKKKEVPAEEYFGRLALLKIMQQPFDVTGTNGRFDVLCTLKGGGKSAQADAVKYGIAKALLAFNPELRPTLKKAGFLTRDARIKERKKYGQRGARARYQWSKR
ncbi:small subunit ribosomal protein S9 [Balnearium lithotrophicum]|jgi:small subunit ribosomal protein S9|uniref:Small ribosomal subunit protein uS9 n=1 Tax=Balnearium lithotrophicum TaxID=223788 RepID=A0A521E3G4_9BACT|nr:30S ribosomal protein S9 [Balnearium lithotrophicum]RUM91256.1 MAG: 30S ribosomal protein S9 [Thermovibrio sp.]SMO77881.1 small subunit ribosomal protein S9 [Balnearium lithotrophicum]